jgi:hypothetical protein
MRALIGSVAADPRVPRVRSDLRARESSNTCGTDRTGGPGNSYARTDCPGDDAVGVLEFDPKVMDVVLHLGDHAARRRPHVDPPGVIRDPRTCHQRILSHALPASFGVPVVRQWRSAA